MPNWAWQAQGITSDFMVLSLRSGTSIKSCGQDWCSAQGPVHYDIQLNSVYQTKSGPQFTAARLQEELL